MKRVLFAVAIVSCAHPRALPPRTDSILFGRVLDENGKPLPLAHVTLRDRRVKVGTNGEFVLAWTPTQRLTTFVVSGPAHRTERVLVAREDHDVEVTVKLGAPAPQGEIHPAVILGSREDAKTQPMTKESDGTYSAKLEAPDGRYKYVIVGVMNDAPSGAPTDGYEVTKDGRYEPQVVIKGGSTRFTFDPRSLHHSYSTIDFARPGGASATLTATALRVAQASQRLDAVVDELLHRKGGPPSDLNERYGQAEKAERTALRNELAARAKTSGPTLVRQQAAAAYFEGEIESPTAEEKALASRLTSEVPPDDPLWALSPLSHVLRVAPNRDYAKAFIARQPDAAAVSKFLLGQLQEAKDPAEARELFNELKKPRYAEMPEREESAPYDPDRPLAPGKPITFDVKSVASPPGQLTQKDVAGTVYLIDIWGTWCPPCVAELPHLHELYAKFSGDPKDGRKKRFEIVSLAAEHDAETIIKFRSAKSLPMPWKNGYADPEVIEKFMGPGMGFPTYILVDENGNVIKSSPQLHPSELSALIDRALR